MKIKSNQVKIILSSILFFVFCSISLVNAGGWGSYDLNGKTVRIGVDNKNREITPFGKRGDYNWLEPEGELAAHIERIEEEFNCSLEINNESGEGYQLGDGRYLEEFVGNIMAGDAKVDAITTRGGAIPMMIRENLILPLDEYIDEDYRQSLHSSKAQPGIWSRRKLQGNLYSIPVYGDPIIPNEGLIAWNVDLFEEEGLESPYELWKEGEWTWENFYDIASQASKDTTGDGEIDQWGFVSIQQFQKGRWFGEPFKWAGSNNGKLYRLKEDGTPVFTADQEEFLESLDFIKRLIEDEIAPPGPPEYSADYIRNNILQEGTAAMYFSGGSYTTQLLFNAREEGIFDFSWVPVPKGPNAQDHKVYLSSLPTSFVIPVTTELNPRAVIEIINAMYHVTNNYREPINIDDELAMISPDMKSYEVLNSLIDKIYILGEWQYLYANADLFYNIGQAITDSPGKAMSEFKPEAQAALNELYGTE